MKKKETPLQQWERLHGDLVGAKPQILASEINRVSQKAKNVSFCYTMIILQAKQYVKANRDKNFYETMIHMIGRILGDYFKVDDYKKIEEEINRLFRTNIFNLVKRKHIQETRIKQFPVLQETQIRENIDINQLINKLEKRSRIPSQNVRQEFQKETSEIRPLFLKSTPTQSVNARSPLVALLMPSTRECVYQFEKDRKKLNETFYRTTNQNFYLMDGSKKRNINTSHSNQRQNTPSQHIRTKSSKSNRILSQSLLN